MKKALFTLAALFIASTALADSGFFFGTFDESTLGSTNESTLVLTPEDLTGEFELSLGAYWSARVSGTECQISFPEGMHAAFAEPGEDCTVHTLNARGHEATETAALAGLVEPYNHWVTTFSSAGYYYNENGDLECYGVNKWEAGFYDNMVHYYFQFDEGFTGGDIVVYTVVASGRDTRGGTVRENGEHAHGFTFTCHVTVEGSVPPLPELPGYIIVGSPANNGQFYVNYLPGDYEGEYEIVVTINDEVVEPIVEGTYAAVEGQNHVVVTVKADGYKDKVATNDFYYHYPTTAPTPEFNWNAETFTMEAVCSDHTVVLYKDGVEVENPYTVEQTDAEQTIVFSAKTLAADEDYNSPVVYAEPVVVPAKEVVVTPPAAPTYVVTYDADFMYITFSCEEGELTIYDEYGQEVAENPVVIERPEYDETAEPVYVHFSAKATKDGVDSEIIYVTEKVNQKAKPEPQPEPTATPEISYEVLDDVVIITATGEGTVTMYVDGVEVDNPYTIARGNADVVVAVTATAQAEGQLISEIASMDITIPALEGEQPEDPHDAGVWVVFFDKNDNEVWYQMTPGTGTPTPYNITLPLNKKVYGYPTATEWPNADFYIMINGVQYGPEAYEELTEDEQFGNANNHELFEGTEHFAVPSGYWYTIGVITDRETGNYYMQISRGIFTGVEELNADKTVAGVRYFNMAGQEMQQADGMTIVVTTYTDGSTSTAKVIK